jgi:predicted nucleic acid-binding protein
MILLDTSFLIAYTDTRDKHHDEALIKEVEIDKDRFGSAVITDYIFDEIMTLMLGRIGQEKASQYGEKLLKIADFKRIDGNNFESAWKMFKEQKNTRFSFTDCTSIVACKVNGIAAICTFDNEFNKVKDLTVISI